jgi:hypothetical protein
MFVIPVFSPPSSIPAELAQDALRTAVREEGIKQAAAAAADAAVIDPGLQAWVDAVRAADQEIFSQSSPPTHHTARLLATKTAGDHGSTISILRDSNLRSSMYEERRPKELISATVGSAANPGATVTTKDGAVPGNSLDEAMRNAFQKVASPYFYRRIFAHHSRLKAASNTPP